MSGPAPSPVIDRRPLHDPAAHLAQVARLEQTLHRFRASMEIVEVLNEHDRFKAAAMALCNEVASRWRAERVSIGFLDGRYVKAAALSHTERFDRRMRLLQDLEAAMEECLDQDVEIVHPRPEQAAFVSRAAEELSRRHGPVSLVALPLRRKGEVAGVLVVERAPDDPLAAPEVRGLRVTCELVTTRLLELRRRDRWLGARAMSAVEEALTGLLGPTHTGAKIAALAALGFVLFLVLVPGADRIDASFQIAAIEQRIVPAPFDGRRTSVDVEPGQVVQAGTTLLARLDTAELQMSLASARAEQAGFIKEADLAMRNGDAVEVQIAQAKLRRVEADIRLLEHRVAQATIVAPIDGTVVSGDLRRRVGAPVASGDVLYEIAALGALRAELEVPEDRMADLIEVTRDDGARQGRLVTVAHPGDALRFEVEHVNPVAEVIEDRNVFRVRVRLLERRDWLRPGMKGVAKIDIGRRPYGALWTRPLVSWLRMKLWI